MLDLNDFYGFKMTSDGSSNGNSNNCIGCGSMLIAVSVIGWVLWLMVRVFG